ncbi:PREDICTED: uncharacterized protein LOC108560317 [Nicrophorus vespilloides]|uniref:Uncharacterized protein LOC108560317 n=1 Tax=Nicrophorus vespilloides TaxID=110193 RepID=A0ABM1MFE7_NICVS|nr:PREDICTED: uncharacterized protein LOC108560317 [Nicrophorus vespilloides]
MPSIELLARTRCERQRGVNKLTAMARLLEKWQEKWESSSLIPEIASWISRKHGEKTFHLSQALSGHGFFSKYLHFIARKEDDKCWYCEEDDSPEHKFFGCSRWATMKQISEKCWNRRR